MQELNELNNREELDNNDDMIKNEEAVDGTISFKVSNDAAPKRGWTKEQKRSVWILAAVITIAVTIFSFIFKDMNILGIFA